MAEIWVRTRWKKFLLNALDLGARVARKTSGGDANRNSPLAAAEVRRILVIELWNIGDVILTLPFLAQLRQIFPKSRVTLLARPHAPEILVGTGLVDDFIIADLGWTEKTNSGNLLGYSWRELFRVVGRLRERRFDLAFQARTHVREHFLVGTSLAKRRIGLAMGSGGGVLTDAILHRTGSHKTDDWLSLLAPFGGAIDCREQRLSLSADERQWATAYLRARGVEPHHTLIGIHPGASVPQKRWPLARFEEVLRSLYESPDVRVISFADPTGYGSSLGEIPGVVNASVSLRQMMALIASCQFLVCNDSGPMHIAAALGVPTVAVFGTGIPKWFSPLGSGHEIVTSEPVLKSPPVDPGEKSIEAVTTALVLDAIARLRVRLSSGLG